MARPQNTSIIQTVEALHDINGQASASTEAKILNRLEDHAVNFIGRSPFLVLATSQAGGGDASPRGDAPGFVKVLDDTTLLLPERPGNRIADSLTNIIANPAVGLIFMIPGMDETLRINGDAYITADESYREQVAHAGKVPKLAIIIDVKQSYFHCAKAFMRSKLWDVESQMERSEFPTLGKILLEQITQQKAAEAEVKTLDDNLDKGYRETLY